MGAFDNVCYGKILTLEFDKIFYHKYFECDMYQFKLKIVNPIGVERWGTFYERYIETVDKLRFKAGDEMMFEINKYKDQLKPVCHE